jgi:CheY-like chemotaxis protein
LAFVLSLRCWIFGHVRYSCIQSCGICAELYLTVTDPFAIAGIFMLGATAGSLVSYIKCRSALAECRKAMGLAPANGAKVPASAPHAIQALVVSRNPEAVAVFSQLLREIGVGAHSCSSGEQAVEQLNSGKFEAVVLDLDGPAVTTELFQSVSTRQATRKLTLFTIASEDAAKTAAMALGSTFLIERPLEIPQIRKALRAVYGRMLRSSQSYFRASIEMPVSIARASGSVLQCTTINVSQNGMAVTAPASFHPGEGIHLMFALPQRGDVVSAEGTIIWCDGHGKAGIRFECSSASTEEHYFEWLQDRFFMQLQERDQSPDGKESAVSVS